VKKILIVGSDGFVGSNLASFYSELNYQVYLCGLRSSRTINYFSVHKEMPDYDTLLKELQPHICINASGSPGVAFSVLCPEQDLLMNVTNPDRLVDAILKNSPNTLYVCLSSAAVYGNPVDLPIKEDSRLQPISSYGVNKLSHETYVSNCATEHNLKAFIVRIFSAFGNGLKKQIFWDTYQKSLTTNTITLFGIGNETRDFISIDQICKAIHHLTLNNKVNGEIYNLASGIETRISEAVHLFLSELSEDKKIVFSGETKKGDPKFWKASVEKLVKIGFIPQVNLKKELAQYAKWLKELN